MSYSVGVDLGATFTAAAVCLADRVEVAPLGTRAAFIPTVAVVGPDGELVFGENAAALSGSDRVARQFTRRVGDDTPLLLGEVSVTAEALAAQFVSFVAGTVASRYRGPAARVALTHPASWGPYRVAALRSALSMEGTGAAVLLSGAQAAAQAYADRTPVAAGEMIAVYDLGGSGLDTAVVRRLAGGEFALAGRAEEVEVGGLDFDELVFEHVRTALGEQWAALDDRDPAVLAGVARLRRACTAAKERLSADTEAWIPVAVPGIDAGSGGAVRLVRAEFEEMLRPVLEETAAALLRAITSAGTEPDDLAAVLLTGGSARIPLLTQVVSEVLGRPVTVAERPKADTVVGAALTAAGRYLLPDPPEPVLVTMEDAPAAAESPDEAIAEPTGILLRASPDPAEDELSFTRPAAAPPAPPRSAALVAPEQPEEGRRRRYFAPGLLAGAGLGLVALLVGGWLWMGDTGGASGADANVNSSVVEQTAPPPTEADDPAAPADRRAPGSSTRPGQPNTRQTQPNAQPVTTGTPGGPPSASPAAPPRSASPPRSSSPTNGPTSSPTSSPTASTGSPSPSTSPSPDESSARAVNQTEPGSDE